ncbi:MAG: DUF4760 domain-containing protein, partial [Candidatus Thorarchaeota archaeon]
IIFAGISVGVAAIYYALNLRHTIKNRKTQLLMRIIERSDNKDYWKKYYDMLYHWKWKDFDEFWEKYSYETNLEAYSTYMEIHAINEGLGLLVKHNMIDAGMVNDWLGKLYTDTWELFEPVTFGFRERYNAPNRWEWFEFLYNKIKPIYRERQSELKT